MCFQIQGELYHLQGPFDPVDNTSQFAQLFFYNPNKATDIQTGQHPELDPKILQQLTDMLHAINSYISLYKMAREILKDSAMSNKDAQVILNPQIRLVVEKGADQRRENLPISNQIADIIVDEYGEPCHRNIVLMKRQSGMENTCMKHINQNHAAYMLLHYVLLFPHGEHCWHWKYRLNITCQDRQQDWVC